MTWPGKMFPFILKMFFEKPATIQYPSKKANKSKNFRGKLEYDAEKCVGCKMCMRNCPAKAIEIEKVADKQFKAYVYLDRCIYCGQCVDSCNRNALKNTRAFELANFDRKNLRVEI